MGFHEQTLRDRRTLKMAIYSLICLLFPNILLEPLILGTPAVMDQRSVLTLATWATKTALVYEFVLPEQDGTTASAPDRKWFSEH